MVRIFIIVFFLSNFYVANSQTRIDSLRQKWQSNLLADSVRFNALNTYYFENTFATPDSTLTITDFHYQLAQEKKQKLQMGKALNEKALAYYIKDEIDTSMQYLLRAKKIYQEIDSLPQLARILGNIGNIYGSQNQFQKAIDTYNETLVIFQKNNNRDGEADMLSNLGLIYYKVDSYDLALSYFEKAFSIYKTLGVINKKNTKLYLGSVYYEKGNFTKALSHANESVNQAINNNNLLLELDSNFLLAKIYNQLGNLEQAKSLAKKSLEKANILNNTNRILQREVFIAELLAAENTTEALTIANNAKSKLDKETDKSTQSDLYKVLHDCYKKKGNIAAALNALELHLLFEDSVKLEKNNLALTREAIQKDYENKLFENELKNQKTQARLTLHQTKKIYTIVIIGLVLIVIILGYVKYILATNSKKRTALLEEIERLKEFQNKTAPIPGQLFSLNRTAIENTIDRKLNETDWNVLNVLVENPVISNKELAEQIYLSLDGIGSSLRRMYEYFNIKESKYKKISLLMEVIKISNSAI